MRIPSTLVSLLISLVVVCRASAQEEAEQLHRLFQERFDWQMEQFPERAMARGDYSRADRITDHSLEAIERRHVQTKAFLDRLHAIDARGMNGDDQLNYELFELQLTNAIEGFRFRMFLAPIGRRFGPQQKIPQMAERVRFNSYEDYANYLKRLEQVPQVASSTIKLLRVGLEEGRTPPQVTMLAVPQQIKTIVVRGLVDLAAPFDRMPQFITEQQQQELRRRFDDQAFPAVLTAMRQLGQFVAEEYVPACRRTIAAIDLPDGEAYYAYQLRVMTTTDMTPREIHELGLSEVGRIRAEMMKVIRGSDFLTKFPALGDVEEDELFREFVGYLRTDSRFYHTTAEDLLAGYRDICKQVDAGLPKLFKTLPRLPYGVRAVPDFMAPDQTTAYYQRGDIRNAEPGWFYANTHGLDQRPKYEMIPLALHEAVPGHHLQGALAQELEGLPEFRKDAYITAFGEGWALYAERLGLEMGLYEDPYDNFGRLLYEMWRACRLVVDPGMHAFGWSRDQAIQFMLDNTALSQLNIETEIDRYISWPGQACAYKIGELKIRALREQAEQTLGEKFDVRAFHDFILGAGAIPLTVLDRRVNHWINSMRFEAYD
ncbi:MAG: DUF885 domain-containing protein [Planctomycetes bacterium]|nr:DUF885 domain-containing protein [Planctomycetota bacterium]